MTQITNRLLLAPNIQEALLFLPRVERGKDPVHEKMLRALVAEVDWERQREGIGFSNARFCQFLSKISERRIMVPEYQ